MSGAAFLRLKKLKGSGIICKAARHNRRVIQAEQGATGSIDPARSHLNETVHGPATADDVAALAAELMRGHGINRQRKGGVLGIEVLFSLPADHALDDRAYFRDCVAWTAENFGGMENIISADIHRDEAAPHCHVLLVPIISGRMAGSDLVGNKQKLAETHQSFHQAVGVRYGLKKAPKRLQGHAKASGAAAVLGSLRASVDSALKSKLWPQLREAIETDPAPYMAALGIEPQRPQKRLRSSTEIFISPGKGPKHENIPIGFLAQTVTPSLCSVGFVPPTPSPTATAQPVETGQHAPPQTIDVIAPPILETVRVRDCDLDPGTYDPETGEFFSTAKPTTHTRKRHVSQAISDSAGSEAHG